MREMVLKLTMLLLVPLFGCEVEPREDIGSTPPGALPPAEPAVRPLLDIPFEEEAWPARSLEVENESDREVSIIAIVAGRVQELGTVPPEGTAGFELRAERDATIELEARDFQDRLVAETTLRSGPPVLRWSVTN